MSSRHSPPTGPFSPGQSVSTCYTFFADDCLLHFNEEDFTAKQREDHAANITLTAMLQVALIYMGRRQDYVALHEVFQEEPWLSTLEVYQRLFEQLMEDVIPVSHRVFAPRENFYQQLAKRQLPGDRLGFYMTSGSNLALHNDPDAWQLSAQLNSKMHFSAHAPDAGIPVPKTVVMKKSELTSVGADFISAHPEGAMIKIQGLAGARNVGYVENLSEAVTFVEEYEDSLDVLLQERLDTNEWQEMTLDLSISADSIEINNVRRILFAQGLWVGNYISDQIKLSEAHKSVCLAVGRYVQAQGYHAPGGLNCGIDFFVRGDDIRVIEINARWTGGLFPAELLKRLGARAEHSVAFIDMLSPDRMTDYLDLLTDYAATDSLVRNGFRLVPMGFSPFVQSIEGQPRLYVWQVVIGDFVRFQNTKRDRLGANELPTADQISL